MNLGHIPKLQLGDTRNNKHIESLPNGSYSRSEERQSDRNGKVLRLGTQVYLQATYGLQRVLSLIPVPAGKSAQRNSLSTTAQNFQTDKEVTFLTRSALRPDDAGRRLDIRYFPKEKQTR